MFDPQVMLDMAEHGMIRGADLRQHRDLHDSIINYAQDAKQYRRCGSGQRLSGLQDRRGRRAVHARRQHHAGLLRTPEATAEVIDADGWFHTGDLARKDEDGYYFLTGRKKNLIILDSGENINPERAGRHRGQVRSREGECVVKKMGKKIGVVVYCDEDKQQQVRDFITEANRTPAAVQADERRGVQHRASAAAQRPCRQAAAPVIQMRSNARMHKWAGRPAD